MRISKQLIEILLRNNWTISVAESCSGGFLAHIITNASGSSNYFSSGYITYSDEAKIQELNIPKDTIEKFSSYSGKVAELMAEGVRKKSHSTFGIATTGIAPPGDSSSSFPTGTVFIGIATANKRQYFEFYLRYKSRKRFKKKVVELALNLLKEIVLEQTK